MHQRQHHRPFSRAVLVGAGLLVALSIVAAATARLTGIGRTQFAAVEPVESLSLRFEDRADGSVAVRGAGDGQIVAVLPPGSNGFVRGVLRGLARERMLREQGSDVPFRLTRWADGRLSIDDPATGRHIDLGGFGPTNAQAFARLLMARGDAT